MKKIVFGIVLILNFVSTKAQSPWVATNTPTFNNIRYEDVSFINKDTGWTVCATFGNGLLANTKDGGLTWITQKTFTNYPRSVEFSSSKRGFLGCLYGSGQNTFWKTLDGGITWTDISSVITNTNSKGICGICSVDTNVTYAVGVYSSPAYVIKTVDGGSTWTSIDMSAFASRLVDVEFIDTNKGFVTGQSNISSEGAVILKTTDGGVTWAKVFTSNIAGEYVWKIQNLDNTHWFASIEGVFGQGWKNMAKSNNGGANWIVKNIYYATTNSDQLQVIGFMDSLKGWTGGYYLYQTMDGGNTWNKMDSIGGFGWSYDRFQRVDSGVAYLTGDYVYKLQSGWIGIKEQGKQKTSLLPELNLFPNPVKSSFTIELILPCKTMYNLRIISISGNTVVWDEVGQKEKAGKYQFKINQKLAAGEYFVYVMTNEGSASKKIIIAD